MNIRLLLATSVVLAPGAATAADIATSLKPNWLFAIAVGKGNYPQLEELGAAVQARMIERGAYQPIENHFTETNSQPFAPTLTLGGEFGRYLGAELSYVNLGHAEWDTLGDMLLPNGRGGFLPPGARYYDQSTRLRTQGYSASVSGRWPLGEHWRVQGRIGAYHSKTQATGSLCHYDSPPPSSIGPPASFDSPPKPSAPAEALCSPITVTNPVTGAPMGGFDRGDAGNLHFAAHSTMPMAGIGVEWVNRAGVGFGLEYNLYRTRTPNVADEDPTPLAGVRSTASVHFLSLRMSFRHWPQ